MDVVYDELALFTDEQFEYVLNLIRQGRAAKEIMEDIARTKLEDKLTNEWIEESERAQASFATLGTLAEHFRKRGWNEPAQQLEDALKQIVADAQKPQPDTMDEITRLKTIIAQMYDAAALQPSFAARTTLSRLLNEGIGR